MKNIFKLFPVVLVLSSFLSVSAADKIKKGQIGKIHYNTYVKELSLIESSFGKEPTIILLDKKKDLTKFEEEILGMKVGTEKKFEVPAKDAFGEYDSSKIAVVKRSDITLPEGSEIVVGKYINVNSKDPAGKEITRPLKVIKADDESVTFDLNHIYAGKDLVYQVRLEDAYTEKEFEKYQEELAAAQAAIPEPVLAPVEEEPTIPDPVLPGELEE